MFILREEKCTGCMTCVMSCPVHAIKRKEDEMGFWYPEINTDKCIKCGKCISVCPEMTVVKNGEALNYTQKAYAVISNDKTLLKKSASGGAFAEIARIFLEDGGIVVGACAETVTCVKHVFIEKLEELNKIQGSKYVQSDINDVYIGIKNFLLQGRKVLFSGTPCQVAGLYSFLGERPKNLFSIDLVCHGVSNQKFFSDYIYWLNKKKNIQILQYVFRSKEKLGMTCQPQIIFRDRRGRHRKKTFSYKGSNYYYYYMEGAIYREACYTCQYASLKRNSDVTLGDYWGINKINEAVDYKHGVSLVIMNTPKADYLLEKCNIKKYESTIEDAVKYNQSVVSPTRYSSKRKDIFDIYCKDGIDGVALLHKKEVKLHEYILDVINDAIPFYVRKVIKKMLGKK